MLGVGSRVLIHFASQLAYPARHFGLLRKKRMTSLPAALIKRPLWSALLLAGVCATANADIDPSLTVDGEGQASIRLTDGSVIVGEVKGFRDDKLLLKTAFSDELPIDAGLVANLRWLAETELLLDDDRVVTVPALEVVDGKLVLEDEQIALADIDIMNPAEWEEGNGYHWTGDTSAAIAYNRGNTQTDEFDVALNTVFESVTDRYTINAKFEQDYTYNLVQVGDTQTRQKNPTADNWKVLAKYDYFLEDSRNYVGINGSVEADALAGIDMRTYAGPYIGRKLIDDDILSLDGELGMAYVSTEYDENLGEEDFDYTAMNWSLTGESNWLGGDSRIYLRHVGILDLEDTDKVILKNTVGLAFPLLYGLEAAAEVSIDYDGTAAADREEIDETYSFRVGYAW